MRGRVAWAGAAVLLTLALGACGGGSAQTPKVGTCISSSDRVVDCSSSSAKQRLVSDQDAPDAIACIEIGDKPQVKVTVAGHHFCAEPK